MTICCNSNLELQDYGEENDDSFVGSSCDAFHFDVLVVASVHAPFWLYFTSNTFFFGLCKFISFKTQLKKPILVPSQCSYA
jgi:hypothetical protein